MDLIERLLQNNDHGFDRNASHSEDRYVCLCDHLAHEAADEIERLRHELAGWETKLQTNGYQRQLDDLNGELAAVTKECDALRKIAESKMDELAACRQELADMMAALEVKKLYWDGTKYVEAQ